MKLSPAALQKRLESKTLKQLYHLCEMSKLTQNIGKEEAFPRVKDSDMDIDSASKIDHRRSKERAALDRRIWKHLAHVFRQIYHEDAEYVWEYAKEEGFLSFVVVWDHWQPSLKEIVCQGSTEQQPDFERRHIWSDSSDEE